MVQDLSGIFLHSTPWTRSLPWEGAFDRKAGAAVSGMVNSVRWILSFLLLMSASALWAQDPKGSLGTQMEQESYSIGYQVGASIVKDGVVVNLDTLIQGLRDAVDGREPVLPDEEMRRLIVDLRKGAQEAQMKKIQELIVKNAEESRIFLEENARKEGVRTTESGLQYVVVTEGEGESPGPRDTVTVHYRGLFPDGTEFDSSLARGKPLVFQTDGVIKGWTEALQMMKVGSKWKVAVPPELAYGRRGMGERIPPNKALVFEMELLSIERED